MEVRIVKDLEEVKEAKEVKKDKGVPQWRASRTVRADWSLANTTRRIPRRVSVG